MVDLCQIQTNIKIVLLFSVRFFKETHDLSSCFLDFWFCSYYSDLFVFLLDVVKGVVDLFEWRLSADSELGHP